MLLKLRHKLHNIMQTILKLQLMPVGCTRHMVALMGTPPLVVAVAMATSMIVHHITIMQQGRMLHKHRTTLLLHHLVVCINWRMMAQ